MQTKITALVFIVLFFFPSFLLTEEAGRIEVRFAPFIHSSKLFREIYRNTGIVYEIQASAKFLTCFEVWSNLDWFSRRGRSVGLHEKTQVNISNCSVGVNFIYPYSCQFSFYCGAGPSVGTIWVHNKSHYVKERVYKTVVGGIFKVGMYFNLARNLFLDVFVDYLYQPVKFENRVNIGGFKPGVGIGVAF